MSDAGAERSRVGRVCVRLARAMLLTTAAVIAVPVVIAGAVLVRLAAAPLDVSSLLRHVMPVALSDVPPGEIPPGRLTTQRAHVAWPVRAMGWGAPLVVTLDDIAVLDRTGAVADRIARGEVTLGMHDLWHGRVVLRGVRVSGARMRLARQADGRVMLDLPGARPGGGGMPVDLSRLHALALDDTRITLADALTHLTYAVEGVHARLTVLHVGGRFGAVGDAGARFVLGDDEARVRAQGAPLPDGRGVRWSVDMDAARPVALHALVPEAAGLETPVALHGWLDFRPAANPDMLQPRAAQATLALGQGAFVQADGSILWLRNAHAAVRADLDSSDGQAPHLDLTDMAAAFQAERDAPGDRDVTLAAHGRLEANDLLHPRHVSATLDAVIPRLDFATILQAWPYGVAKGARAWISRNITQGTGERLTAHVGVAGNDGWQHLRVTDVAGGMDAHGLDIHWLRPVPPMHGVDGHLTFDDPTSLSITFEHGYQEVQRDGHHVGRTGEGRLTAGQGSMRIEHLDQRFQTGDITVRMAGDLADAVALLDEKRLNLLARHPFPFTNPSGRTEVELRVTLPLRNKVAIDDVTLDAHARETDIHLGNAVMGRSVDHGNIVVSASTQGLTASGTLLLGGVPSRARYSMDFARNPAVHVTEQGHLTAHLTPQTAEGARIPASRFFGGSAAVDVDYGKRSDDTARIALALDMKDADVHIPIWHKPAGRPGNASVVIDMAAGHLSGVHDLVADGPDLDVRGHTEVHDGTVDALAIDRFRIGRSAGRARVRLPRNARDPYQVTVRASAVDLSPLLHGRHQPGGAPEPAPEPKKAGYHLPSAASGRVDGAPGQSWSVDLATPVLYYDDGRTLSDVTARLVNNGVRLTSLDFAMRGPSPATVTVRPDAGGRRLSARVDDTGALLGATGVMSHIDGGVGTLEGRFDDRQPSAPFAGTLSVGPFVMRDAPGMLRLVNDLSVFGWFDGQSASDFPVDHLAVPLRFQDGVLHIDDGEVGNRSVGATVQGHVDLDHDALDLNGTLTPAFAVNALPGRLPGVGRLFSPERGGGVLSATYTVTGPIAGPKLHVNPLSVLLPGIFRKMVE